jgi:hypothetical protein
VFRRAAVSLSGIVVVLGGIVMCILGHLFLLLLRSGRHFIRVSDRTIDEAFWRPFEFGLGRRNVLQETRRGGQPEGCPTGLRPCGTELHLDQTTLTKMIAKV